MNLCAKLIVGEKRTRLNHELIIDKLVILHMNLKFMIYCRGKHALIGKVNEVKNLCAKLIVGEKRTRLNHELIIDKLVILHMNLKFMIYCRGKHALIGKVNEVQNDMGNDEDIYAD